MTTHGRVVVAIDGTAGAGKSTTARMLASRLGVVHIDSGATYRLVGLRALAEQVPLSDEVALGELAQRVAKDTDLVDGALTFAGTTVGPEIRTQDVAEAASRLAAVRAVRDAMVALQRRLVPPGGAVMEGRDIGSVVLPDADVRVYLDADPRVRAGRRAAETDQAHATTLQAVQDRDARDAGRAISPMRPAPGGLVIDTTELTPEQVVDEIVRALEATSPKAQAAEPTPPRRPARARRNLLVSPEQSVLHRAGRKMLWLALYALLRGPFRFQRGGMHNIPATGAAILAPNHRSLIDHPVVALLTRRRMWFMGKDELWGSGSFGRKFLAFVGAFPVKRGSPDRRALDTALELLERGELLVVYPEGTRTPDARFAQIEEGVAYLAMRSGAPVVPIALSGTEAVFPRDAKLPRVVKIRALVGEPIDLGSQHTGVVARSKVAEATTRLHARLLQTLERLEPGA